MLHATHNYRTRFEHAATQTSPILISWHLHRHLKVESQRERVEAISAEDKAMEKSFKKDFAEAEEHVNQLYQLFRKRVVQHAATGQVRPLIS